MDKSPVCVFEWRYGSEELRSILSVENLIKTYAYVEYALVKGLAQAGLIPMYCIDEVKKCIEDIDYSKVYAREKEIGHEIASLVEILSKKCGECGKYIHFGATSYDIVDTAWAIIIREALKILRSRLRRVIEKLMDLTLRYRDTLMVGRTHGQHALPITLGFKLANYVYELARSYERLCECEDRVIRGKISGAVGTMASWRGKGLDVEKYALKELGLEPHAITTQVAPRDGLAELVANLAILASQLDRFALEIRELSRPEIHEVIECRPRVVGSSTMPHKKNPVIAERICGLARLARSLVITSLENIVLQHERDLTNSSSERVLIPHILLIVDQMLLDTEKLLSVLKIDEDSMRRNLDLLRGSILSEALLLALIRKGLSRIEAYSIVKEIVESMKPGERFIEAVKRSKAMEFLSDDDLRVLEDYRLYLGNYRELIDRAMNYANHALERC